MKYLKGYKLFEARKDVNLKDIEEVFYNISDSLIVKIMSDKLNHRIKVYIYSKDYIDFEGIKDDLVFAIDYISKELKLDLLEIKYYNDSNLVVLNDFNIDRAFSLLKDDLIASIILIFSNSSTHNWGVLKEYKVFENESVSEFETKKEYAIQILRDLIAESKDANVLCRPYFQYVISCIEKCIYNGNNFGIIEEVIKTYNPELDVNSQYDKWSGTSFATRINQFYNHYYEKW